MKYQLKTSIYLQIKEDIENQILAGTYPLGQKIPAFRDLAVLYDVNINTIQRAIKELEQVGYLCGHRTTGKTVTQDHALLNDLKMKKVKTVISSFMNNMIQLGYKENEIVLLLKEYE